MAIKYSNIKKRGRGFTVLFAMLVSSLALAIGVAIYDITVRELDLSSTATQSQYAIYAADTGAECALYWDSKNIFATSSQSSVPASGVLCNGVDIASAPWTVESAPAAATTTFIVTFSPQPYCASVTVAKSGTPSQTTVTSRGYNASCAVSVSGTPKLERVFQVSY